MYTLKKKKLSLRRKTLVRHNEENAKFDKNSIRKAYKEIIQYYCCYFWYGLILGSFHYLTKNTDLQIVIFEKTYKFFVFLRKMKEKKLPSEEIVQYYCCYHWCGLILGLFHYLTKKNRLTNSNFRENPQVFCFFKKDERERS